MDNRYSATFVHQDPTFITSWNADGKSDYYNFQLDNPTKIRIIDRNDPSRVFFAYLNSKGLIERCERKNKYSGSLKETTTYTYDAYAHLTAYHSTSSDGSSPNMNAYFIWAGDNLKTIQTDENTYSFTYSNLPCMTWLSILPYLQDQCHFNFGPTEHLDEALLSLNRYGPCPKYLPTQLTFWKNSSPTQRSTVKFVYTFIRDVYPETVAAKVTHGSHPDGNPRSETIHYIWKTGGLGNVYM